MLASVKLISNGPIPLSPIGQYIAFSTQFVMSLYLVPTFITTTTNYIKV